MGRQQLANVPGRAETCRRGADHARRRSGAGGVLWHGQACAGAADRSGKAAVAAETLTTHRQSSEEVSHGLRPQRSESEDWRGRAYCLDPPENVARKKYSELND